MGEPIKLSKEVSVVTSTVKVTQLTLRQVVDLPAQKRVTAFCMELGRPIVLWSDDAYKADMSWTLSDVQDRLKEIVESGDVTFGDGGGPGLRQ